MKARSHEHGVGGEHPAVDELYPEGAVGLGDARHRGLDDGHARGGEGLQGVAIDAGAVVHDDREPVGEVPHERSRMQPQRCRHDLHHPAVAHLPAVAEGAVDDLAAPPLSQPVDLGQLVGQAGCDEHPSRQQRAAAGELEAEEVAVAPHIEHAPGQHFAAVGADFLAADRAQLGWRCALAPEVAVHVCGGGVACRVVVDDDDRPALAGELQRAGEAGGRPADHSDVAAARHGGRRVRGGTVRGWGVRGGVGVRIVVVAHVDSVGSPGGFRMPACTIRKGSAC